jgi:hypothetical protein
MIKKFGENTFTYSFQDPSSVVGGCCM